MFQSLKAGHSVGEKRVPPADSYSTDRQRAVQARSTERLGTVSMPHVVADMPTETKERIMRAARISRD